MENPADTQQSIWITQDGQVRWDVPKETEMLTLEERRLPQGQDDGDVKDLIEKTVTSSERDWRIFRHGVPTEKAKEWVVETLKEAEEHREVDLEDEGPTPAACADTGSDPSPKRKPSGGSFEVFEDKAFKR